MEEMKKYLDLEGLTKYDEMLKTYIDNLFGVNLEWKDLGASEEEGESNG